jgi:hypothetical protein
MLRILKAVLLLAAPLVAQNGAVIEGVAFNKITKAGVPGVGIRVTGNGKQYQARSDASGTFRIEGVADGVYTAMFDSPIGFIPPRPWEAAGKPFNVAAGSTAVKLDVPMTPMGKLSGRVLDPDGKPAAHVPVEIFRVHGASGSFPTTDEKGRFHEENIVPGAYRIRARPVLAGTPLAKQTGKVSPLPDNVPEGERWMWAPTYFPNAVEIANAQSIFIHEGDDLDGFDIRLRAAPAYRLRGAVLDHDGKAVAGASVSLLSEIGWGVAEAEVKSGGDGAFEFPSVRAGEWRISAEASLDGAKWKGYAAITMPKRDFDKLTVRVNPPFQMEGTVEGLPKEGRMPLMGGLIPLDAQGDMNPFGMEQPNGSLRFENVYAGRYRLDQWTRVPGYYLKNILLGTADVTGRDVDLAPGSPPVHFVFVPNAARVTGLVENGAGAKVVLIDPEQSVFVPGQAIAVAICDPDGHFTLESLRPGAWYAFAFATNDNMNTGAIRDAVFVSGLARQAQTLQLKEGETATLNLKISPWPE